MKFLFADKSRNSKKNNYSIQNNTKATSAYHSFIVIIIIIITIITIYIMFLLDFCFETLLKSHFDMGVLQ